jgi:hypothetical protein
LKNLLFDGQSIRQEKDWGKKKTGWTARGQRRSSEEKETIQYCT